MTRDTREFLLFTCVFFDYEHSTHGPEIMMAIAATTTTEPNLSADEFDEIAFPAVQYQLTLQPRALDSRIREILERKVDDPEYRSEMCRLM